MKNGFVIYPLILVIVFSCSKRHFTSSTTENAHKKVVHQHDANQSKARKEQSKHQYVHSGRFKFY